MSDDRATPPGVPPSWYRIDEMRVVCGDHASRIARLERVMIIAAGDDGRGGRLEAIGAMAERNAAAVAVAVKDLSAMNTELAIAKVKIAALVLIMSSVGGILGGILATIASGLVGK